jgi:hypothetical protein
MGNHEAIQGAISSNEGQEDKTNSLTCICTALEAISERIG